MNKFLSAFTIVLLLLVPFAFAQSQGISWYPIAPWELDFCKKWGGTQESEHHSTTLGYVNNLPLTVTLQAKRTPVANGAIHVVSFYVDPLSGEVRYTITLSNGFQTKTLVEDAVALAGGVTGTFVETSQTLYTTARINVSGIPELIEVPIVETE